MIVKTSPVPYKFKEPVKVTLPEFCVPVLITDSIVSVPLPLLRKKIFPSGTFIANSPSTNEDVVGIDPGVRLLFCFIGISYINMKY